MAGQTPCRHEWGCEFAAERQVMASSASHVCSELEPAHERAHVRPTPGRLMPGTMDSGGVEARRLTHGDSGGGGCIASPAETCACRHLRSSRGCCTGGLLHVTDSGHRRGKETKTHPAVMQHHSAGSSLSSKLSAPEWAASLRAACPSMRAGSWQRVMMTAAHTCLHTVLGARQRGQQRMQARLCARRAGMIAAVQRCSQ